MKLVFICKTFPYGKGEEFISNELQVLADRFDEIIVVPYRLNGHELRPYPRNAKISPISFPSKALVIKHWRLIFTSLYTSTKESMKAQRPIRAFFTFLFFHVRAKIIKQSLEPIIESNTIFYTYWTDESALACALLHKQHDNAKFVCRAHRYDLYHDRSPFKYLPYRRFIYKHAQKVLPISKDGFDYLKMRGVSEQKLRLSRLGVPVPTRQMPQALPEARLHILSCSYISPVKRLWKIIEVLSLLDQTKIHWTHIGGGPELNEYQKMAKEELACSFEFLGNLANDEIHAFYQNNNITFFINLSESEGIPVTMMEAISYGVPIVSNDVGGVSEIVTENTGLLVNKDDTAESIAQMIMNYEFPDSSLVKDFHLANYNSEKNYRQLCVLIKSVS